MLAARGAKVVLNSFTDSPEDNALARRIAEQNGAQVQYIQADMSDPDACRALIAKAAEAFGGVDILAEARCRLPARAPLGQRTGAGPARRVAALRLWLPRTRGDRP